MLAIAAIAAVVAGCGNASSSESTPSVATQAAGHPKGPAKETPISKAQYIAQANKICVRNWGFLHAIFMRNYRKLALHLNKSLFLKPADAKKFRNASKEIFLPSIQILFDDVQYLGSPSGEQDEVEAILGAFQQEVYAGAKKPNKSPAQFAATFSRFNRLAGQYGIDSCLIRPASFRS